MFIENGYGKTIHLRVEDYIDLTDEEWQEIIASGHGEYIEDPFVDYTGITSEKVDEIEEEIDEDIDTSIDTESYE
jgi:hypothetical protein